MSISKVTIKNFKGIRDKQQIFIKPITLFIGKNSSGKSSCLHALACLAQTAKIPNDSRPLIIDDSLAQVHLGRFIEASHTKSYTDPITLGVEATQGGKIYHAEYDFKCSKTSQEIKISRAELSSGDTKIIIKPKGDNYEISHNNSRKKIIASRKSSFFFAAIPPSSKSETRESFEDWFQVYAKLEEIQMAILDNLQTTNYLGPFRQSPKRSYPTRDALPIEVGAEGESTIPMLAIEATQKNGLKNTKKISDWVAHLGLARSIDVNRVSTSDLFEVNFTLNDNTRLPIADLGYGISQVLPVLTQCAFTPKDSTLIFEQPELHLHQGSSKKLSKILIETALNKNSKVIAETHSPELFKSILQEIKNGNLSPDSVAAYKVERNGSHSRITPIQFELIDGQLDIDPWEDILNA